MSVSILIKRLSEVEYGKKIRKCGRKARKKEREEGKMLSGVYLAPDTHLWSLAFQVHFEMLLCFCIGNHFWYSN